MSRALENQAGQFPPPETARADGLLCAGGDLRPERLLAAYSQGIFPWYEAGLPILWWTPDPRCVLPLSSFRLPRRSARLLRLHPFELTLDAAFGEVIRACAGPRSTGCGTWLSPEMIAAYERLHAWGFAIPWRPGGTADLWAACTACPWGGPFSASLCFMCRPRRRARPGRSRGPVASARGNLAGLPAGNPAHYADGRRAAAARGVFGTTRAGAERPANAGLRSLSRPTVGNGLCLFRDQRLMDGQIVKAARRKGKRIVAHGVEADEPCALAFGDGT